MRRVTFASPLRISPAGRRSLRAVAVLAAVVGALLGLQTLALHLSSDPFADAHVYYDAATRLNAGLPLYDTSATDSIGLYLNPPLLAVLFRPLALLPFAAAVAIWELIVMGSFVLVLRRIGLRQPVLIALGCLALPILWALSVGQAEPIITLLLAIGSPAAVALAGHLKLLPWLVAAFWLGRRDLRSLTRFAGWTLAIGALQLLFEPAGTLAYLQLTWLRPAFDVRNVSPFAIHPALWLVMVAGLVAVALRFARTPWGWPLAVSLVVLTYPRLLVYQLTSLLAAFGGPRPQADQSASRIAAR